MKRPIAPPRLSNRLARLMVWAGLWLAWVAAALTGAAGGFRASRVLDAPRWRVADTTRFVIATLVIRALALVKRARRAPRAYGPNAYRIRGSWRALVGVALRRKFRSRTLLERILKLADGLRHPEKYLAAIAKRVAANLTKRVRLYAPEFVAAALCAACACGEAALDSS